MLNRASHQCVVLMKSDGVLDRKSSWRGCFLPFHPRTLAVLDKVWMAYLIFELNPVTIDLFSLLIYI